jgi:polyhydroxyalkanoate synthesis regulator phasin
MGDCAEPMPDRKSPAQRLPDAVREAVERTIDATRDQAKDTRGRAQDAVDDLVKGAEASATAVRERVRGAIEERRPATSDDIKDLQREIRALGRRLDAIEERLPKPRASGSGRSTKGAGSRKTPAGSARKGRSAS